MAPLSDANRLSIQRPSVAVEWDSTKNDIEPFRVSIGSDRKAFWICATCKHEWSAKVCARCHPTKPSGCPACSGRAVTDANRLSLKFPSLVREWSYNNKISVNDVCASSHRKVLWTCSTCSYEWSAAISARTRDKNPTGCIACAGKIVSDQNRLSARFPEIASEWNICEQNNGRSPDTISFGSSFLASWKCKKCSYTWSATVNNRCTGYGCPSCAGRVVTDANRLSIKYPHLVAEWHPDNIDTPETTSFGSNVLVKWQCAKCAWCWVAAPNNRCNPDGRGCPACSGKVVSDVNRLTLTHPAISREWSMSNAKNAADVSFGSAYLATWICKDCKHEWTTAVNNRTSGTGCPACASRLNGNSTSKIEIVLAAEFAYIFYQDADIVRTRNACIKINSELSRLIDSKYNTFFSTKGLRPDICISGAFANNSDRLLVIEWDSQMCHSDEYSIRKDTAKTIIINDAGHLIIRMREHPLEVLIDVKHACVSVGTTAHNSKSNVKRAIDVVIRYLLDQHGAEFTKTIRRHMLEYVAALSVQNYEAAQTYLADFYK